MHWQGLHTNRFSNARKNVFDRSDTNRERHLYQSCLNFRITGYEKFLSGKTRNNHRSFEQRERDYFVGIKLPGIKAKVSKNVKYFFDEFAFAFNFVKRLCLRENYCN